MFQAFKKILISVCIHFNRHCLVTKHHLVAAWFTCISTDINLLKKKSVDYMKSLLMYNVCTILRAAAEGFIINSLLEPSHVENCRMFRKRLQSNPLIAWQKTEASLFLISEVITHSWLYHYYLPNNRQRSLVVSLSARDIRHETWTLQGYLYSFY